jgi:hypothetical protein
MFFAMMLELLMVDATGRNELKTELFQHLGISR